MTCLQHEHALLDVARGASVDVAAASGLAAHLDACEPCAARMAREQALTAGLRALAGADAGAGPSPALEARLLAMFEARQSTPRAGRVEWRSLLAAAAAVALLTAGLTWTWRDFQWTASDRQASAVAAGNGGVRPAGEFVPWPGAGALPTFESGELVRTELPASVLPLLGIAPAGQVDGTVLADVLIGQDGLARAVRLVP